jgi:hypothetical protein
VPPFLAIEQLILIKCVMEWENVWLLSSPRMKGSLLPITGTGFPLAGLDLPIETALSLVLAELHVYPRHSATGKRHQLTVVC